jgi:hypothetical protein
MTSVAKDELAKLVEATENRDVITLNGRRIALAQVDIPLQFLRLDRGNQRVALMVQSTPGGMTDAELEEALWKQQPVRELGRAIRLNGGLTERIIVSSDGTVIEGNCRTVCYRRLHREEPQLWASVPSRVLPADVDDRDIALLLGDLHVAGKNQWDAFEQAAYVYRMIWTYGYKYEDLAGRLRKSKSTIHQLLRAYQATKDVLLPKFDNGEGKITKFSFMLEFIKTFPKATDFETDRFADWVVGNKFARAIDVRQLRGVMNSPRALEALEAGDLDSALDVLRTSRPDVMVPAWVRISRARETMDELPQAEIRGLKADSAKLRILRGLYRSLTDLADLAGVSLLEDNRNDVAPTE